MTRPDAIETQRFHLRPLRATDVTHRYLHWLQDQDTARHIVAASTTRDLADLQRYVAERVDRDDVLFLGVFDRVTNLHVGNIKYEPVDEARRYAVMGVLIGDPAFRGIGAVPEILLATGQWLRDHRGIAQIVLGVDETHSAAIRAYQSVGFAIADTPFIAGPHAGVLTMVWRM